jgi:hypothetical protein
MGQHAGGFGPCNERDTDHRVEGWLVTFLLVTLFLVTAPCNERDTDRRVEGWSKFQSFSKFLDREKKFEK